VIYPLFFCHRVTRVDDDDDDDEPSCRWVDVGCARFGVSGASSGIISWTFLDDDDDDDDVDTLWIEVDETLTSFLIAWMYRRVPPSFARTSVVVFYEEDADAPGP